MLHATSLLSQLLAKQLQRQDEINRQIITKRIAKVEQQKQTLHNSLQLKDEFLNNVCQELRTPLTHMKTALSLLNSPSLKNPQRQRYLEMLKRECDRQNSLIHGVLELVQIEHNLEEMNLESVRLADIVPGVVSTYQPLAQEKGIMLAYTVPTELPAVWCVTGGLRQLVIHLLSNSIKYTPNGGQVWVRGRLQGDYVLLELRDTGIGIAESEIPKIFDRFYRVRPLPTEDPGGAGLGLTIVQQLLRNCGGSISVKSKLSEGSTFTVQLAIASDKPHEN
jgi:signal transduction histidine kinase